VSLARLLEPSRSSFSDGTPASVAQTIDASPAIVFGVIVDPTTYPEWLAGAQHIRKVDPNWPENGARFHHTVGVGPLRLRDHTAVVSSDPPSELILEAHLGPLGSALVRFRLREGDESANSTIVELEELPQRGVIAMAWVKPAQPLVRMALWGRNAISLVRLAEIAHDRSHVITSGGPSHGGNNSMKGL